ncbi:hypothetical protein QYF61_009305 [Mycteria americana]|uniref:Uncharacterized protein n=1 Tax=Mycteria americana TaxID=33587 RepID=A0AAN7SJ82_MYCAM|nr:hypothetical protein QYF61_009305 [Mycteria americana]
MDGYKFFRRDRVGRRGGGVALYARECFDCVELSDYDDKVECLWGWQLNHFPGQPVPMLDNPFSEEKFPNIQSKPPLAQLEAISSRPIICYLGEETNPHLSITSLQGKKKMHRQWKQGQVSWEEYKDTARLCRDGVGKAKEQLKLNLARDAKNNKKGF